MQQFLIRYACVLFGCFLSAGSINLFLMPHQMLASGVTGIAGLIYIVTGLPVGLQVLAYNVPLLIAAYKMLGFSHLRRILFGTVVFSLALDITAPLRAWNLVPDVMLACIFGGVFNGIGYGILFRMDTNSGGFDIVAAIMKKYYSIPAGNVTFGINCVIMAFSAILIGVMPAMYTLISIFVSSMMTDKVVAGFVRSKGIFLISDHGNGIAAEILMEIGRGVTILKGEGAFTRQSKQVLFVVVSIMQLARVKAIAKKHDPIAFLIVMDTTEVMGRGFTLPMPKPAEGELHLTPFELPAEGASKPAQTVTEEATNDAS